MHIKKKSFEKMPHMYVLSSFFYCYLVKEIKAVITRTKATIACIGSLLQIFAITKFKMYEET